MEKNPETNGDKTEDGAQNLKPVWLEPLSLPNRKNSDEDGIRATEHGWPQIVFGSGTSVREQQGEADDRPDTPTHEIGLNFALIGSDGVRNDTQNDYQAGKKSDVFFHELLP